MGTANNRGRYDRGKLRYPSDLTDAEWELVEPLSLPKTSIQFRPLDWQSPANQGMIVA